MELSKIVLFSTALFSLSVANAHNIWLEPTNQAEHYVIKFGHKQTEAYPEQKLKEVKFVDQHGKLTPATHQFREGEAYINAENQSIVLMQFDNGVWSKLPSGKYVEKTKAQEPSAEFSTNPVKLGKAILHWNAQASKAHDLEYELIPQQQPQANKTMSILVLHKGQPVSGIKVGLGEDQPFNLTNDKGIVEFTPSKGFNKVWAEFEEKALNNPDYDRRSIEYMLTFYAD
ncbi:hypothetical protein A4G18_04730 [Pasteurellaceae bacterium Pebbles2]|nr:hypothetical protein [Pasteurellaceae bacterium Pebbles2]